MNRYVVGLVVPIACAATAGVSIGGEGLSSDTGGPTRSRSRASELIERPRDRPAPPSVVELNRTARSKTIVERNGFVSVQVNVTDEGLNVEGDAANEPSIAVDPTAPLRMTIGWRQFDSISSDFREAGWGWSADGGRSWRFPGVLQEGVFRSDPVLAADTRGRFFYYSLVSDRFGTILCDMFLSEDRGQTWIGPISAFGGDKAWMTLDTTVGIGRGHVYVNWSTEDNQFEDRVFIRSLDRGLTYTQPIALVPAPIWGTLTVGPDGGLNIVGNEAFALDRFVLHRSMDAQDPTAPSPTFEVFAVDLGGSQANPGWEEGSSPNPGGLLGQVWIAADHSDGLDRGNLYVVGSVDPVGDDPQDVHFVRSVDGGATWSAPVAIHSDDRDAWQWFGTMSVAPGGRIDVVWIESLTSSAPNIGELRYVFSMDAGDTWSSSVAITPVFDSWLGWPQQNKMGDYFHMVSDDVGADLAYAATFNEEQDVYHLRIGDTDCNRNGVGDSAELTPRRDCNSNGIIDSCEIAADTAIDDDDDGVIDDCHLAPRRSRGRVDR